MGSACTDPVICSIISPTPSSAYSSYLTLGGATSYSLTAVTSITSGWNINIDYHC